MIGTRDARADGFKSRTHGDSGTGVATSTGSTAIAGDGLRLRLQWPWAIRTRCGIRGAGVIGRKRKTDGDFRMSMGTPTGSTAMAGDGTTDALTARQAARTTIARLEIIEPTSSSRSSKDTKANSSSIAPGLTDEWSAGQAPDSKTFQSSKTLSQQLSPPTQF
jgi:hypothetical protein